MSRFLLPLACAVLAVGALPYFQHRWVADESWYSVPAVTLVRTGELRNPAMPAYDLESRVDCSAACTCVQFCVRHSNSFAFLRARFAGGLVKVFATDTAEREGDDTDSDAHNSASRHRWSR